MLMIMRYYYAFMSKDTENRDMFLLVALKVKCMHVEG
jgi:hypothetical protein